MLSALSAGSRKVAIIQLQRLGTVASVEEVGEKVEITAWMIRKDKTAISCMQHIYVNPAELDETLYAAEWLYQHTLDVYSKILCLKLIKSYGNAINTKDF